MLAQPGDGNMQVPTLINRCFEEQPDFTGDKRIEANIEAKSRLKSLILPCRRCLTHNLLILCLISLFHIIFMTG